MYRTELLNSLKFNYFTPDAFNDMISKENDMIDLPAMGKWGNNSHRVIPATSISLTYLLFSELGCGRFLALALCIFMTLLC